MIVAVTGATGFIGNHVVMKLLERNENIRIVATSRNECKALNSMWFGKVEYIPCDLYKDEDCFKLLRKPDCLIHLAWNGLSNFNKFFHFEDNLLNDYLFLKNMIKHGVKRLFVSGTCMEYGLQEGCLSEDIHTDPCTCYGFAKDTLRKMLDFLLLDFPDVSLCWGRLFYMYGAGQNEGSFVPLLKKAIYNGDHVFNMSGGKQVRDFSPVEIISEMIVELTLSFQASGVYNICSGEPKTLLSLAEEIVFEAKSTIKLNTGYYPYPEYEPMEFWGDKSKWDKLYE